MWSVAHLGVRSRRLRLHVRVRCMWVPGGQRWSDAVGCGLPFATQALRNASDRHAEAWVCLVNQCAVSLRPCASPSLAQCLRGPVQAWLSKARRHAQARCSSVSECTAQLRPDASARKKNVVCVLGPHWQTLSEEPPGGSGHRQVVSKVKGLSCIATCGAKALQDRACRLRVGVRRRTCDYRRCAPRCVAQEAPPLPPPRSWTACHVAVSDARTTHARRLCLSEPLPAKCGCRLG